METKAMIFAIEAHASTNHTYDNKPYSIHLTMVANIARKYIDIIPEQCQEEVLSACWLHDTIEDCRLTYNDILKVASEDVANIVYAVSNEKGKNRKERANDLYYFGIRNTAWATYVKFCDRLANVKYSKDTNSKMLSVYQKENKDFIDILIGKQSSAQQLNFYRMIKEMDSLLAVTKV